MGALYLDLLGRSADPMGLKTDASLLASGAPVSQIVNSIMASPEYQMKE